MNKLLTYTLISSLMISTGSIYADISIRDRASGQDNRLGTADISIGNRDDRGLTNPGRADLPISDRDRRTRGNLGGGTVIDGLDGSRSLKCDRDGVCPMDAIPKRGEVIRK